MGLSPFGHPSPTLIPGQPCRAQNLVDRPATPAAKAGLTSGDIITAIDELPIYDADSLVLNMGKLPADAVVHLSLIRDGHPHTIDVKLTKYAVRGK